MIVLLTDFGQSEYMGIIKGVIYDEAPQVQMVDLCHDVSPQSIIKAMWILMCSYRYFSAGTIFCFEVDPCMGTRRRALAMKTRNYHFMAPDNGLLWETLTEQTVLAVRQIPVPGDASRTFHGRDVFAKAAAQIYPPAADLPQSIRQP